MEVTYSRSDCDQDCGPARATLKRNISALAIIGLGLSSACLSYACGVSFFPS